MIVDKAPRIDILRLRNFLGHKIKQNLQRSNNRIRNRRHTRAGEIVGFFRYRAIRNAAIFSLDVHRKIAVCPVAVHPLNICFDKLSCDLGIFLDIIAARGNPAKRIIKAMLGEID